jgi:hypothetical protein
VIVRDPKVPAWAGRYVFGDYCRGRIEWAHLRAGQRAKVHETRFKVSGLSSFGEDARGRVYATSVNGPVYRLVQK